MNVLLAFAVGMGNLGVGSKGRRSMDEWVSDLNTQLASTGAVAKVASFFGHAGNFVIQPGGMSTRDLKSCLAECLGKSVTTVELKKLRGYLAEAAVWPKPPAEPLVRWTAGLVFRVSGEGESARDFNTERAVYRRLDGDSVAVWKRDCLTDAGILDRQQRMGGWGAVAKEVGNRAGDVWTGRSLRTVDGLIGRAGRDTT